MPDPRKLPPRELRTPRAAAIAGIAFAVMLAAVVLLMQVAAPGGSASTEWITESSRRQVVSLAMGLVPYAGIAFLWFIGVIRTRLGQREDKFFATAFLGSGLLFVACLFSAAAVMGGALAVYGEESTVSTDAARLAGAIVTLLLTTFGIRMAAVFTLVVTTAGRRTGIMPTWLVLLGYVTGLILLLAPPETPWATLIFPAWVLVFSVQILVTSMRHPENNSAQG